VSGGRQTEPGFPLGFCLCLAPFSLFFILKILPVLNNYKNTHNLMQPPLCLKIWRVVISNVLYWICPKHNTVYSGRKENSYATFFSSITLVPCCKQDACFGIFLLCTSTLLFTLSFRLVLWSNYNVVDPSSVSPYHSH
jgi:hypothetical protein